jgi:hypothetical protein
MVFAAASLRLAQFAGYLSGQLLGIGAGIEGQAQQRAGEDGPLLPLFSATPRPIPPAISTTAAAAITITLRRRERAGGGPVPRAVTSAAWPSSPGCPGAGACPGIRPTAQDRPCRA